MHEQKPLTSKRSYLLQPNQTDIIMVLLIIITVRDGLLNGDGYGAFVAVLAACFHSDAVRTFVGSVVLTEPYVLAEN